MHYYIYNHNSSHSVIFIELKSIFRHRHRLIVCKCLPIEPLSAIHAVIGSLSWKARRSITRADNNNNSNNNRRQHVYPIEFLSGVHWPATGARIVPFFVLSTCHFCFYSPFFFVVVVIFMLFYYVLCTSNMFIHLQ